MVEGSPVLEVQARGPETAGSWRSLVLLDQGRYVLTARARTVGFDEASATGTNGLILRKSGDKLSAGSISPKWTALRYEFEVSGVEDVELVCEFRGSQGSGQFDPTSMRLVRLEGDKAPPVAH